MSNVINDILVYLKACIDNFTLVSQFISFDKILASYQRMEDTYKLKYNETLDNEIDKIIQTTQTNDTSMTMTVHDIEKSQALRRSNDSYVP